MPHNHLNAGASHGAFSSTGSMPSTPADVDALFQYFHDKHINKMVLHFHGGLVPEEQGIKVATFMADKYQHVSYPVSVVWETGWYKTLIERLEEAGTTELFKELLKVVLRKAAQELNIPDGAKGNIPVNEQTVEQELRKDKPFDEYDQIPQTQNLVYSALELDAIEAKISAQLALEFRDEQPLTRIINEDAPSDPWFDKQYIPPAGTGAGGKGGLSLKFIQHLAKVTVRVIRRFWEKTAHGFYPTVVEEVLREFYVAELGKLIWYGIKEKSREMWEYDPSNVRAGRYFLDALNRHKTHHPEFMVDLVGHSAGSIAICNMLQCMAVNYPSLLPVRNIVLLAPACRTDLFDIEIMSKPERFKLLRIFTMDEIHEQQDECVRFLYTRSLLYLISGILEEKPGDYILGLAGQLQNEEGSLLLTRVKEYLSKENRLILSPSTETALSGFKSNSLTHGDFDNESWTVESLITLAQ